MGKLMSNSSLSAGQRFLTLPGEELIVAKRQHPIVPFLSIFLIFLYFSVFIPLSFYFLIVYAWYPYLFLLSSTAIVSLGISAMIKSFIDWYYHLYIVTNKKILELSYSPFFSSKKYQVLLNQVRTTEIDARTNNFLYELMDMGDVIIAFDRPSHEQVFVLSSIRKPKETSDCISSSLTSLMQNTPVWFEPRRNNNIYKYYEDYESSPSTVTN